MTNRASIAFRSPPIAETVFGVQFGPLNVDTIRFAHVAERLSRAYPRILEMTPLPPSIERPIGAPFLPLPSLSFLNIVPQVPELRRVQLLAADGNSLLQLQRDRFHYNWHRPSDLVEYPRFERTSAAFFEGWEQAQTAMHEVGVQDVGVTQLDLTYLNHIHEGPLWDVNSGVDRLLPWLRNPLLAGTVASELECSLHHDVAPCNGRLHVLIKSALHLPTSKRLLTMELTLRGFPPADRNLQGWFQTAHEHILSAFVDLTSDAAHAAWEMVS